MRSHRESSFSRLKIAAATVAISIMAGGLLSAPAHAADLKTVERQVEALQNQAQTLGEDYVEAVAELKSINNKLASLSVKAAARQKTYKELSKDLNGIIRNMYKTGGIDLDIQAMISSNPSAFLSHMDAISIVGARQQAALRRIVSASVALQQTAAELKSQQAKAKEVTARAKAKKIQVEQKLAQAEKLLKSLKAAERKKYYSALAKLKRAQAAARAALAKKLSKTITNKKIRKVISWALSRVGGPYRIGAAGPRAFDCSGFTMTAYKQIGVSLPHWSRAQPGATRSISRKNLRPGDLIFFFRGGIRHVGLYIGGGKMVHAENYRTGIRISSIDETYYLRHVSGYGRVIG
ncbi:MAG: hypothetical protein RL410_572 [Actinomycetota bacterium]|jgi:cell wall-associated NlpC family hydrolase